MAVKKNITEEMFQNDENQCKEILENTNGVQFINFKRLRHHLQVFYDNVLDNLTIALWVFVIAVISVVISVYQRLCIKEPPIFTDKAPTIMLWISDIGSDDYELVCGKEATCTVLSRQNTSLENIDAFVFTGSKINFSDLPSPRRPQEVVWAFNQEYPDVSELSHEKILNLFNFSATFSRFSDVPYPKRFVPTLEDITGTKYFVNTSVKNSMLSELAPIIYLQSSCHTSTDRHMYVTELMNYIKIDSYGMCLRNKEANETEIFQKAYKLKDKKFHNLVAKYKFVLAIENFVCDDYSTEKLWRSIETGTVPIYFGDPLIRDWLPNKKSAILLEDFPTPKYMSEYIKKLNENDDLYEEYLEHKIKRLITNEKLKDSAIGSRYHDHYEEVDFKLQCLLCKRLYAKRYGNKDVNIVNKYHYNCPEPISALGFEVNTGNYFTWRWRLAKNNCEVIYKDAMNGYTNSDYLDLFYLLLVDARDSVCVVYRKNKMSKLSRIQTFSWDKKQPICMLSGTCYNIFLKTASKSVQPFLRLACTNIDPLQFYYMYRFYTCHLMQS